MHQTIAAVGNQFINNTELIIKAIDDIDESSQFIRPDKKGNSINWVMGHITSTRFFLPTLLGSDIKCPFGEIYDQKKELLEDSAYPNLNELKKYWDTASKELIQKLSEASEETLLADIPFKLPAQEQNVRGTFCFLLVHESYHFGQLAYIRRLLDYSGVFG